MSIVSKIKTAPVFMLFAFCMGSSFLLADTFQRCILIDKLSLYLIILYLLCINYSNISYTKLFSKVRWFFPIIWVLSAITFNLYLKWVPEMPLCEKALLWGSKISKMPTFRESLLTGIIWLLYKPVFVGWMYWKTYSLEKRYNLTSDPVNTQDIYICLWRPQTAKTMFQSLFGVAVGSVCLYANGYLYGFKWGEQFYQKRETPPHVINRKFIAINTGKKVDIQILYMLNQLIGVQVGLFRLRCIYTIRGILRHIDSNLAPRWYNFIPCQYGIKILRWKNDR